MSIALFFSKYICRYFSILLLALAVRVIWILFIPQLHYAPDESSHWLAVKYLSENFMQPSSEEIMSGQVGTHLLQLQMSYFHMVIVNILAKSVFNEQILIYICRFANALLSLIVVVNCKYFYQKIFKNKYLASLLSLAIAFHPQYVFISSYINNDVFTCWVVTLAIIFIYNFLINSRFVTTPASNFSRQLLKFVPISIIGFCALYTKSALLVYIAFAIVATITYLQKVISSRLKNRRLVKTFVHTTKVRSNIPKLFLVLVLFLFALSYLPYYLYTTKLSLPSISAFEVFNGTLMAETTFYPLVPKEHYNTLVLSSQSFASYLETINKVGYWQTVIDGFWGFFGLMTIKMDKLWYDFYLLYLIIFFLGILKVFYRPYYPKHLRLLEYIMCLVVALMCIGSLSFSYKIGFQPQGRHFLPIIIIFYYFLAKGLQSFKNSHLLKLPLFILFIASLICTTLYVPLNLFRIYYVP